MDSKQYSLWYKISGGYGFGFSNNSIRSDPLGMSFDFTGRSVFPYLIETVNKNNKLEKNKHKHTNKYIANDHPAKAHKTVVLPIWNRWRCLNDIISSGQ